MRLGCSALRVPAALPLAMRLPLSLVSPAKSEHDGKREKKAASSCTETLHQEQRKLISGCSAFLALCAAERNNRAQPWRRQRWKENKSFPYQDDFWQGFGPSLGTPVWVLGEDVLGPLLFLGLVPMSMGPTRILQHQQQFEIWI